VAYATVDELAAALRVRVTPENTATLQACLDAAAVEIDHDIDAAPPNGAAALHDAVAVIVAASWLYSNIGTAADPGAGIFRTNKTNPPAITAVYVSATDHDGQDRSGIVTLKAGGLLFVSGNGKQGIFTMTAAPTDNGGWFTIPADYTGGTLSLTDGAVYELGATTPEPPPPEPTPNVAGNPLANRVNILRGVEWWKANDAAFGVIGFDQTGPLQAPRDGFNRHRYTLTPLKEGWGIA